MYSFGLYCRYQIFVINFEVVVLFRLSVNSVRQLTRGIAHGCVDHLLFSCSEVIASLWALTVGMSLSMKSAFLKILVVRGIVSVV